MAIGKASDFTIYQDEVQGAIVETLVQASNYFNGAGNSIRLTTESSVGDYAKETFFQNISSVVSRRDTTSVASATDLALTQDEMVSVKLNRKFGPVAQTLDAFKKIGRSAGEDSLSFLVGTQIAKAMEVDMLDRLLQGFVAATVNQTGDLVHDAWSDGGTLDTTDLVNGLAKFGDAANRIAAWVMRSEDYFNLVKYQITVIWWLM